MIPNEMLDEIALFVLIFTSILIFYVAIAKRGQSLISDWRVVERHLCTGARKCKTL